MYALLCDVTVADNLCNISLLASNPGDKNTTLTEPTTYTQVVMENLIWAKDHLLSAKW